VTAPPLLRGLLAALLLASGGAATAQTEPVPGDPGAPGATAQEAAGVEAEGVGEEEPPVWLVAPFVALLGMIATGPLLYPHHWHRQYPKYAVGLGLAVAAYYLATPLADGAVLHAVEEYVAFIGLLLALFVASGTILIKTDFAGTPRANVGMLLAGAVLANVIGTTGASMLLIRPYLRLNRGRVRPYHVVFFIFAVSNVGGALTPIGDPPLFLGFLRGVPFFWTLQHLWYIWLPTLLLLLGVFYAVDRRNTDESVRERARVLGDPDVEPGEYTDVATVHTRRHVAVEGRRGLVWLGVIIGAVFLDPSVFGWVPDLHALGLPFGVREVILLVVAGLAYATASPEALRENGFTFGPMKEVAWLFAGIFLTMQPALALIRGVAAEHAGALDATAFYFGTGVLSSVLDNAPTYVAFVAAAMGTLGLDVNAPADVAAFAAGAGDPRSVLYLQAISVAAVFWGAVTYIGNGPNFMVKAIAEGAGVACPSFGGYVGRYALPVLIPTYLLVWLAFFSGLVPRPAL
jgi:Na+/H+ antiporter NhaD/arsenite permease-like protein